MTCTSCETEDRVINHFGLSGGKDSTALWGWAINDSGYPVESIRGSFADTENEYDEVYDQIRALDAYGQERGVTPVRLLRSEGFLNLAKRKGRFPGARARFCTEVLKIIPSRRLIEEYWLNGWEVVSHSGVRRDESVERSQLEEWGENQFGKVRRPLLDWSISDVWAAHHKYGLPINPLYKMGWKRVGCRLCIMSGKADVRRTARKRPWVIDEIRQWEHEVTTDRNQWSSFFPADTVPNSQHSRTYQNKKGKTYTVATIDDVVRWATTTRGGVQQGMDFLFDEDDAAHPCMSGYCE